jgi:hypothetical protein
MIATSWLKVSGRMNLLAAGQSLGLVPNDIALEMRSAFLALLGLICHILYASPFLGLVVSGVVVDSEHPAAGWGVFGLLGLGDLAGGHGPVGGYLCNKCG